MVVLGVSSSSFAVVGVVAMIIIIIHRRHDIGFVSVVRPLRWRYRRNIDEMSRGRRVRRVWMIGNVRWRHQILIFVVEMPAAVSTSAARHD